MRKKENLLSQRLAARIPRETRRIQIAPMHTHARTHSHEEDYRAASKWRSVGDEENRVRSRSPVNVHCVKGARALLSPRLSLSSSLARSLAAGKCMYTHAARERRANARNSSARNAPTTSPVADERVRV